VPELRQPSTSDESLPRGYRPPGSPSSTPRSLPTPSGRARFGPAIAPKSPTPFAGRIPPSLRPVGSDPGPENKSASDSLASSVLARAKILRLVRPCTPTPPPPRPLACHRRPGPCNPPNAGRIRREPRPAVGPDRTARTRPKVRHQGTLGLSAPPAFLDKAKPGAAPPSIRPEHRRFASSSPAPADGAIPRRNITSRT